MNKISNQFNYKIVKDIIENWITDQIITNPNFSNVLTNEEKKLFSKQLSSVTSQLIALPAPLASYYHSFANCVHNGQSIKLLGYKGIRSPEILSNGNPPHFIGILPVENFLSTPMEQDSFYESIYDISYIAFNFVLGIQYNNEKFSFSDKTEMFSEIAKTVNFGKKKSILFKTLTNQLKMRNNNFVLPERYSGINS
jgi:hypothetical protein